MVAGTFADDLAQNKRPANMKPDEELVYDFCTVLHRQHFIDDKLFQRAMETLGERGVVDLVAVSNFYSAVSMILNVAETPPGREISVVTETKEEAGFQ